MTLAYADVLGQWKAAANHTQNNGIIDRLTKGKTDSLAIDDTMAAIAMAESSGNPRARNASTDSRGLWQINWSVWRKDKDIQKLTGGDGDKLYDPAINAKAAVIVYKKQGLTAWEAYTNGAYSKYKQGGLNPDTPSSVAGVVGDATGVTGMLDWVKANSINAGIGALAVVALILGVVLLVVNSKPAKAVTEVAGKVVK